MSNAWFKNLKAKLQYQEYYCPYQDAMLKIIDYYKTNNTIAIWGSGLKGMSFLNCMDPKGKKIDYVIDMNQEMQGKITPTGHRIVSHNAIKENNIGVVFVMNKVFYADVDALIHNEGYRVKLIDVDELIENNINFNDVINNREYTVAQKTDFNIREIQNEVLTILKEFDRICKKNNIEYFLSAGTALGAVREKGFVPWDDDVDVGMLREEFEKFRSIVKKDIGKNFYFQTMERGNDYYQPFDQLAKNNTSFVRTELAKAKLHHGLHIDIFPFDNVSENEEERIIQLRKVQHYRDLLKKKSLPQVYYSKNIIKKLIVNASYYKLKLVPKSYLMKKVTNSLTMYDKEDSKYIADLCTHYKKIMYFDRKDIVPTKESQFETERLPIPYKGDSYLTMMYGDYMTPPPEGKRMQKYRLVEVSCSKNYYLDDVWLKEKND